MADTDDQHEHPTARQYIEIAAFLAAFTTLEVLLYVFREPLGSAVTTPLLIILTILKFALVALWFMHLRFDIPLFRQVFLAGILLAGIVFAVVAADYYLGVGPEGF